MKYKYSIDFAGNIDIYADSPTEAMQYFKNWLHIATGNLYMYGYNITDEKELEVDE